jgi:hypothetical protein
MKHTFTISLKAEKLAPPPSDAVADAAYAVTARAKADHAAARSAWETKARPVEQHIQAGHAAMTAVEGKGLNLDARFEARGKAFAQSLRSGGASDEQARKAMALSDMNRTEYAAAHRMWHSK